jgi:hypothetical protein
MSDRDVMALLAAANPVRVQDLAPLDLPDLSQRRLPSRRLVLAIAFVLAGAATSLIGVFVLAPSGPKPTVGQRSLVPPPTIEHPLFGGHQVSISKAGIALRTKVVLPNTALVNPSETKAVWLRTANQGRVASVAVSFPGPEVIVQYDYPVPYPSDPLSLYKAIAANKYYGSAFHVVDLGGTPALAEDEDSDQNRSNFGSLEFVAAGIRIAVLGHYDQARLQAVAQSILDRSSSSSSSPPIVAGPVRPPTPVADAAAANALLPFTVVLPTDAAPTSMGVYEESHQLAAYFDTPASGPYNLVEGPTTETVAMLRETAKRWRVGPIREIDVVDGVDVLLQGWSDGSLVASWIRLDGGSKILTWVRGPETAERGQVEGTFTKQQALAVADDIIAQGG